MSERSVSTRTRRPAVSTRTAASRFFPDAETDASQRLLASALEQFATKGFHAATTRAVGEGAGMSPAAVYVHYASKTDLLFEITRIGHRSCLDAVEQALADAPDDPGERVRRFIETFAQWHAEHQMLARVSQYELNALPTRQLNRIVKLRQQFDAHLQQEFQRGVDAGVFEIEDVQGAVTAALSLCIDLARWYVPRPGLVPEQVARLYAGLVVRMVSPIRPARAA